MSDQPACPEDSRHNHEDRFIPGVPGVIPAPPPPVEGGEDPAPGVPTRGRGKTKTDDTVEAAHEAASPVEEEH